MKKYPGLTAQPWHDPQQFAIVRDLERNAAQIIAEARSIDPAAFLDEPENIKRSGRWGVFYLVEHGSAKEHNCHVCPITSNILANQSTVAEMCGMVYFSILEPGTHVAPHKGPTNMRLRCHFGIEIPDGCGLRVNGETVGWESGRCLVFEDSFEHEVWNTSEKRRTILVIDIWHPDLSQEEVELLDGLQRYAAGHRRRLSNYRSQPNEKHACTQAVERVNV